MLHFIFFDFRDPPKLKWKEKASGDSVGQISIT